MHAIMFVAMEPEYFEEGNADLDDYVNRTTERYDQNNDNYYHSEDMECCDDPKCSQCEGTGSWEQKYNPDGIYDWYEIGGRWNNVFYDLPYDVKGEVGNVIRVSDFGRFPSRELRSSDIYGVSYLVDSDGTLYTDVNGWLTYPRNQSKYLILVDYHS